MTVSIDRDEQEMRVTRTVRSSGSSTVVALPPEFLRHAGLEAGDEVELAVGFDDSEVSVRKIGSTEPNG